MLLVQCNTCGAQGYTAGSASHDPVLPDEVVRCGCCDVHDSHEAHVGHVRAGGDASCRPVTITLLPGAAVVS